MNTNKLITFVVPAYNVENYLGECIQSLLDQTVINHRIIVVNDGSKDNSGAVADKYAAENPEMVTVIHQQNQGLSAARNAGLALIDTPYVTFLDSDDWQDRRIVELFTKLIERMDETPDLVFTMPTIYDMRTRSTVNWMDRPLFNNVFEVRDGKSNVVTNVRKKTEIYGLEPNACRKIYRTEFLRKDNFAFPVGLKWEDIPGHFHLLHKAFSVAAIPDAGFFYRVNHPGQITGESGKSRLDMIQIFHQLLDICENDKFRDEEKVHAVSLIMRYTVWSLDTTNMEYIDKLIEGIKGVFARISPEEREYYLYWISQDKEVDRLLFRLFDHDKQHILSDYLNRDQTILANEIRNRPAYERLSDCIADHGVKYTAKLFTKKFILHR